MEARTEQQLSKHFLNTSLRNTGSVIFGFEFYDVLFIINFCYLNTYFWKDAGFFARIK